jgi:hypothetical protein
MRQLIVSVAVALLALIAAAQQHTTGDFHGCAPTGDATAVGHAPILT